MMSGTIRVSLRLMMALGAVGISSCSADKVPAHQTDAAGKSGATRLAAAVKDAPKAKPLETTPTPTEMDNIMLDQAEEACKSGDFSAFFVAAMRSKLVRARYFISPIKTEKGVSLVDSYRFPIELVDFNYMTSESIVKDREHWDDWADWEDVQVELNQAQDERYRVDWVRIDYGPNGNDDGETPKDDKLYGPRGFLIFQPTIECWTLIQDGYEG